MLNEEIVEEAVVYSEEVVEELISIESRADLQFELLHNHMRYNYESTAVNNMSYGAIYERILQEIPEVREGGLLATVDYRVAYEGDKGSRSITVKYLAYYRAMIYYQLLFDDRFKELRTSIDELYSFHLSWYYRLRDQHSQQGKPVHLWLN